MYKRDHPEMVTSTSTPGVIVLHTAVRTSTFRCSLRSAVCSTRLSSCAVGPSTAFSVCLSSGSASDGDGGLGEEGEKKEKRERRRRGERYLGFW